MKQSKMIDHTARLNAIVVAIAMIPLTSVGLGYLVGSLIFG